MIRKNLSFVFLLVGALALVSTSGLSAQTKRTRRAPAPKAMSRPAGGEQGSTLGFGVPESLSGKIVMVVPDQNLLVVSGPNGVPYDMVVTPKTVIVVGDSRGTLESLAGAVGRQVSVGFVPKRDGDYATRIEVTS